MKNLLFTNSLIALFISVFSLNASSALKDEVRDMSAISKNINCEENDYLLGKMQQIGTIQSTLINDSSNSFNNKFDSQIHEIISAVVENEKDNAENLILKIKKINCWKRAQTCVNTANRFIDLVGGALVGLTGLFKYHINLGPSNSKDIDILQLSIGVTIASITTVDYVIERKLNESLNAKRDYDKLINDCKDQARKELEKVNCSYNPNTKIMSYFNRLKNESIV